MSERRSFMTCGSKGGGSAYDPQIGAAAQESANTAAQAQQWSQNFYTNSIAPALAAETAQANTTSADENQLFNLNYGEAQKQADEYNQYGLPATTNYYKMVANYSAPQMEQQQAEAALGDNKTAQGAANTTFNQQLGAAGVNAGSAAAIEARGNMATANAASNAAAETRARYNAQQLGIQLTSDAVNVANGGASQIVNSSGSAGNASQGATGALSMATGSANASSGTVLQGDSIAANAYGNNLNAYSRLGAADIQANAEADAGFGQFLGAGLGAIGNAGGFSNFFSSDRRLKRDIVAVSKLASGLTVYAFNYIWGGMRALGVMADEVMQVIPEAVQKMPDGYYAVDYSLVR